MSFKAYETLNSILQYRIKYRLNNIKCHLNNITQWVLSLLINQISTAPYGRNLPRRRWALVISNFLMIAAESATARSRIPPPIDSLVHTAN